MFETTITAIGSMAGTLPDSVFYTTDPGREGIWNYDPSSTEVENYGTILRTGDGKVLKRLVEDHIVLSWFVKNPSNANFASYFNDAITAATAKGMWVLVPPGVYHIKSPIYLDDSPLRGVEGQTTIVMDEDFIFDNVSSPRNGACFYNTKFSSVFNDASANMINIDGINFQMNVESNTNIVGNILLLANVKEGRISNCNFNAKKNVTNMANTLIDNYACVKNLTYENCVCSNYNEKNIGGVMWVRNLTFDASSDNNVTEGIRLYGVTMNHASTDEALAVFGSIGVVRDVIVDKCHFNGLPTSVLHSVLVSVYPQQPSGGTTAAVYNIKILNSTFTDEYYLNYILRVGRDSDTLSKCDNIVISNNTFNSLAPYRKDREHSQYVILNVKNQGFVEATDNKIFVKDILDYGIYGFNKTTGNYIYGLGQQKDEGSGTYYPAYTIITGVAASTLVSDNFITAKRGILDADGVFNNVINASQYGVERWASGLSNISNNNISITAFHDSGDVVAFYSHRLSGTSTNPEMIIVNNVVSIPDGSNNCFFKCNFQTANTSIIGNKFTGQVNSVIQNLLNTPLQRVHGNVYNDVAEDTRDSINVDVSGNYIKSLPVGYSFNKKTVSNSVLGFQKVASSAGTESDWQAIYEDISAVNTSTAATVSKSDLNTAYPANASTGIGMQGFSVLYPNLTAGAKQAVKLDNSLTGNWLLIAVIPAI